MEKIGDVFCIQKLCLWPVAVLVFQFSRLCLVGTTSLLMFIVPLSDAVAQFPGVGREAPSGVATQAGDSDYNSISATGDNSKTDDDATVEERSESGSAGDGNASADEARTETGSDDNDNASTEHLFSEIRIKMDNLKKEKQRKQLFIKKLRIEFAALELVERKSGLPFSRDNVPRYLDLLRNDLEMIAARDKEGELIESDVKSVARDTFYIETHLNDYLDQLLKRAGQPVPKKNLFARMLTFSNASKLSRAKLDALYLKFELASYGNKVLQAMGTQGN